MDLLVDASKKPCECGDKWIPAATSLLENNAKFNEVKVNPVTDWRNAMLDAMQKGRKRGYILTHVGIQGTEVAKGASAMILTDDNFVSIVSVFARCGKYACFGGYHALYGRDNFSAGNFRLIV